jgi:glycosyltransferase involved in cell wall biosynthesis
LYRIACILPKGEGFSPQRFGAVALCVRDFTHHSRHLSETVIIGSVPDTGFDGIRYVALPHVRWYENRTRSYARQCVEVIRKEQVTLVEIHNRPILVRLMAPKLACRIALHLHNDPQEMDYTRTPRERGRLLEQVDAVYCVSDYIRARFLEGLENAQSKVHLIYNGIDLPESLPVKENCIVFAGRMTEGKGALALAQALSLALPRLPGWRAVVIGSRRHAASDTLTQYESQVAEVLVPRAVQVELAGFLPHETTLAHFARADIAVVPSVWQEPFGRTALEAMAYGCAVISSGRGGLREVTQDAALTLGDVTPAEISDAILTLAGNADKRKHLQQQARDRAAYFAIAERTRMLDEVRDSLLAESGSRAA